MFRVNKQKCVGCQVCLQNCPGATKIGRDGKAEIIDQEKLGQHGGESICLIGAIEKISNEGNVEQSKTSLSPSSPLAPFPYGPPPAGGKGLGIGKGMGAGRGRGLSRGPRDGRGGGRGGGGRRY